MRRIIVLGAKGGTGRSIVGVLRTSGYEVHGVDVKPAEAREEDYTHADVLDYAKLSKLIQGADGVVFVADSQSRQLAENVESFQDLHANLADYGIDARTVPLVIQYNKQDLPSELILESSALSDTLNFRNVPEFSADALHGPGVFETLRSISELVLKRLSAGAGR